MLSAILKSSDCAACKFCCSFRRTSLWETPVFTQENIEAVNNDKRYRDVLVNKEYDGMLYAQYDISDSYTTNDPKEEAVCPFLDVHKGCTLNDREKPWDCKIWPLRVVKKPDGSVDVVLTPTCPSINKLDIKVIKDFLTDELRQSLIDYAVAHPYLIKEFREGFFIDL